MREKTDYITFLIGKQCFALPLNVVEQVVQVVQISSLPQRPDFLHGVIDFHGVIIPVVNIHFLFGLPSEEIKLSDQLIITKSASNLMALLVNTTQGVHAFQKNEIVKSHKLIYGEKAVKGVVKLKEGMVLINDIEKFLDLKELEELEVFLTGTAKETLKI